MNNSELYYYVKRMRLLTWLVNHNFTEYEAIPDPTSNKGYKWWVFKKTPELEEAITEYFAQFK